MEKSLPEIYEEQKIDLKESMVGDFAWTRECMLSFLKDPAASEFAILGGDVLRKKNNIYIHTYDNWYLNRNGPSESFAEYSRRSRVWAFEYVSNYDSQEDIYFAPVITSEITGGLLSM